MPDDEQELVSLYHEWRRLDRAGDYAQARAVADQIRRVSSDSAFAAQTADTCEDVAKLKQDFWTESEADFHAGMASNPRSAAAWTDRAAVLVALDRFDEALLSAQNAVELDPHSELAWRCLGVAMAEVQPNQSLQIAPEYFDKAIALEPRSEWAWFHKGMALSDAGRHREALDCFSHIVVKLNSKNEWAWYCQALTLENLDRATEAAQSYTRARSVTSIARHQ